MPGSPPRIVVVGGGISGLAAAFRTVERIPSAEVILLEAGSRIGGVLNTEHREGFLIEQGAENFITTIPWGIEFCRRIGFLDQLVQTNQIHRRAFVVHQGKLKPIPEGFAVMAPSKVWPVMSTPVLSPWGKLRLAAEYFLPGREVSDESLASFVKRRFGHETFERLVQPLVSGIYAADPEKLSVRSTMPRFLDMERQHGSLIRAMLRSKRKRQIDGREGGARYSQFVAPRNGMSSFVDAIAAKIPPSALRLNSPVRKLSALPDGRWDVFVGRSQAPITADGVILALQSFHAAELLNSIDSAAAAELSSIDYQGCALATFGFRREQISHRLDGFGFVVPRREKRKLLSATFSSVKYEGRAPDGHVLIRTYLGGACQPELLELDDGRLLETAFDELSDLLGIQGRPVLTHVGRQRRAMPQYHVGHLERIELLQDRLAQIPGLALIGSSQHGVGIPHCIHAAERATDKILEEIGKRLQQKKPVCL